MGYNKYIDVKKLIRSSIMSLEPTASYQSSGNEPIYFSPGAGPHTTDGVTTKISNVVAKAGGEDRDRPSAANDTPLGHARAQLTTLQDILNVFLTKRMQGASTCGKQEDSDFELRVLDDGVDEDSD